MVPSSRKRQQTLVTALGSKRDAGPQSPDFLILVLTSCDVFCRWTAGGPTYPKGLVSIAWAQV